MCIKDSDDGTSLHCREAHKIVTVVGMLTCTRQCAGHKQHTRTQSHDRSAVSYSAESAVTGPPAVEDKATERTTLHKSWTTPWNSLLGQCALKGGCQGRQPLHRVR